MARILVAGGLYTDEQDSVISGAREKFALALGHEIIARGHVLLGGCRTSLDTAVASGAAAAAAEAKLNPRAVIQSWVTASTVQAHDIGEIFRSHVKDWSQVPRRYVFPEPIQNADVIVIVGGWDGTHYAASWGRLANKPIVPVAALGLAAAEIFEDEVATFDRRNMSRVTPEEFQILNRVLAFGNATTVPTFVTDVVTLAERMIRPTDAFVIMSFAERGDLNDAYDTFVRVCKEAQFAAFKIDEHFDRGQRIVPGIMNAIRRSAFIIADLSDPRPNVYYELGYAQALGKDIITTAHTGTQLPFDVYDVPILYWDSQRELREKLQVAVGQIAEKFGRAIARA